MANQILKNINSLVESSFSEPVDDFKNDVSGQSVSDRQTSDKASVWKDKYLHLLADLENTKKRLTRAATLEIEGKNTEILKDVLQIADGLDLVLKHLSGEDDSQNIYQGINGLKNTVDKFFIKYDVKIMDALGAVFDPNLHEALGMIRNPAAINHTVVQVEKKGYLYNDKLLRPALVLVATG